ncbi:gas vesicle protein [Brevibacterium renqingii]|uniref:gas vesicle protein GvpO n=1 Tax=Brevibacterium renqingii TaxID=2776916 RepID=UPI001ADF1356|nr:gas vesicle protein [Brevibacterium renqingii]
MSEEPRADENSADEADTTEKRARKPSEKESRAEGTSRRPSASASSSRERPASSSARKKSASSAREKSASSAGEKPEASSGEKPKSASPSESRSQATTGKRISAVKAVKKAIEQFSTLTGRPPESVVGTRWKDDHWSVRLEVVESRRIPDSADLLAEYEVELDEDGELMAYDRKDRYVRGRPSE